MSTRRPEVTPWFELFLADDDPPYVSSVPVHLRSLLREYLEDLRTKHKRAASTLDIHGRSLTDFLTWLGEHDPTVLLVNVWPDHIALYMDAFRKDGRVQGRNTRRDGHQKSIRTMSSKVGILRAFFAWAKRKRLRTDNPVEGLEIDWGARDVHPLSDEQVAELIRVWTAPTTHPRVAAIGLLALTYGLSTGIFLNLPVDAVDLKQNVFYGLRLPAPIPEVLHPVLNCYLQWREATLNGRADKRFVVTKQQHGRAPNRCFFVQILKPYGVNIRQLRATALAQTILKGHLKLLTVFGMTSEGMRRYQPLARLAQNTRQVKPKPNLW